MSIGKALHAGHWSNENGTPEWKGPEPYLFNISGPFGDIQSEFYWTLDIYIQVHQHAYLSFRRRDLHLDELAEKLKSCAPLPAFGSDEYEATALSRSRRMDQIFAGEQDLERSIRTINRMFVVALWALSEQYLGKIYQRHVMLRTAASSESIVVPYRWDAFKKVYPVEGVLLTTIQDFAIANECRVLNNHIKHEPLVSNALAVFPPFAGMMGKPLEDISVDPQRYLNGTSNFIGALIEKSNAIHGIAS